MFVHNFRKNCSTGSQIKIIMKHQNSKNVPQKIGKIMQEAKQIFKLFPQK
jgi:hypothetical protein